MTEMNEEDPHIASCECLQLPRRSVASKARTNSGIRRSKRGHARQEGRREEGPLGPLGPLLLPPLLRTASHEESVRASDKEKRPESREPSASSSPLLMRRKLSFRNRSIFFNLSHAQERERIHLDSPRLLYTC